MLLGGPFLAFLGLRTLGGGSGRFGPFRGVVGLLGASGGLC